MQSSEPHGVRNRLCVKWLSGPSPQESPCYQHWVYREASLEKYLQRAAGFRWLQRDLRVKESNKNPKFSFRNVPLSGAASHETNDIQGWVRHAHSHHEYVLTKVDYHVITWVSVKVCAFCPLMRHFIFSTMCTCWETKNHKIMKSTHLSEIFTDS